MMIHTGMGSVPAGVDPSIASYCSDGRLHWLTATACWSKSLEEWQRIQAQILSPVAPPHTPPDQYVYVPTGSGGGATLPPNPADAGQVVTDIVNQQMVDQQMINAGYVKTTAGWVLADAVVSTGDAITSGVQGAADAVQATANATKTLLVGGLIIAGAVVFSRLRSS